MKNENTIWSNIIASVNAGLALNSVTDFVVKQSGQPSKTTIDTPTIWVDRISDKRHGYQSRRPVYANSVLSEIKTAFHEIIFQITARKLRHPATDTASTQTSSDVLNLLIDYFNGAEGMDQLASVDMGCIRVTSLRTPASMSDSDLYERDPSFDITISFAQETTRTLSAIEDEPNILITEKG